MADLEQIEDRRIAEFLSEPSRVAVIGMKSDGPALSVPRALASHGFEIVPVNPRYDEVDGRPCFDRVDQIPEPVRIVDIFRRSETLDGHVDEMLRMEPLPELVWFQLGIRNDAAARRLDEAGISVVQDRCIKVEYSRLVG